MKKFLFLPLVFFLHLGGSISNHVHGQNNSELKISAPFKNILVDSVEAWGDLSSGEVKIILRVTNRDASEVNIHFRLGGFESFGITDDQGNKYKLFTSEKLHGTADINKGYKSIATLYFGDKRSSSFMYARQLLNSSESKTLAVNIKNVDKEVRQFKELHILCRPTIEGAITKEEVIRIENIKVDWRQ